MKAKIFYSIGEFNKWAKGKALTKDIIIHTIPCSIDPSPHTDYLIIVYHPEDPIYDKTELDTEKDKDKVDAKQTPFVDEVTAI